MMKFLVNIQLEKILELYHTTYMECLSQFESDDLDFPLHSLTISELFSPTIPINSTIILPAFYDNLIKYFKSKIYEEYSDSELEGIISIVNTSEWICRDKIFFTIPFTAIHEDATVSLAITYDIAQ